MSVLLFVRDGGNDGDGLTVGNAKSNPQNAFDVAFADTGVAYVLDIGTGTFAGVTLTADWPSRISVQGAGAALSNIGGINGFGADAPSSETGGGNGLNIEIIGNGTVNLGDVLVYGGSDSYGWGGGSGGVVTLTNVTCGAVVTVGGNVGGSVVGYGGSISLTDCITGSLYAYCGSDLSGYSRYYFGGSQPAGNVTLVNSTVGDIAACGTTNQTGGNGSTVILTDSTAGAINASAGDNSNGSNYPGSITLLRSAIGAVSLVGGGDGDSGAGSSGGGTLTCTDSSFGTIDSRAGTQYVGATARINPTGTTTIHGNYRLAPSFDFSNTALITASDLVVPDILGTGLL